MDKYDNMRIKAAILASLALVLTLAGCNSSDDESTTSSDCAITAVTMGTLSRTYTRHLSSGKDTTYTVTVPGSAYPLHIDQINHRIFNTDSLPVGTKLDKIYFTTFTADGTIAYRLESGRDTLFTTRDTIDFTSPRIFTVYATDGSGSREYVITITAHNVDPNAYSWNVCGAANSRLAGLEGIHMVASGGNLYLWGTENGSVVLLTRTASTKSSVEWEVSAVTGADNLQPSSVNVFGGVFYAIDDNGLVTSSDGAAWTSVSSDIVPDRILAVSDDNIYVSAGGEAYHSPDGLNWTLDSLDDSSDLLPSENICSAVLTQLNNSNIKSICCVGYTDSMPRVWKKEVDLVYPENYPWSYYPATEETPRTLPYLKGFSMKAYNDDLYAVGMDSDSLGVYISYDGARSWQKATEYTAVPSAIGTPSEVAFTVDEDNYIWIAGSGNGLLLRGYLNSVMAAKNE